MPTAKVYFVFLLFIYLLPTAKAQSTACNNWLSTPSQPSAASLGDLDIAGNQITVEATFNRTTPYVGGRLYAGDLVSKHLDPTNTNYLLRPSSAEITTTNGYFITPNICDINLNQTYHAAMVYDGATLKFYRDGFLMSQIKATGNLFQNNFDARIGLYFDQITQEQFVGYINEVRIWNVARTQSQLQAYMSSSLPNPSTQTGLVAYYTFDNLQNKQGNTTWNGKLVGAATINATNPKCTFIKDSCGVITNTPTTATTTINGVINNYTPVLGLLPCDNKITVGDGSAFNVNDTVLIIQMKGAVIDTSNTSNFGTVLNYKSAGNYEYNYVKQRTGNVIELKKSLTRTYDIAAGKVQLVRVPYYKSVTVSSTLTCLPWDGTVGGILALNVLDTLYMNADLDVSGKGFRKGIVHNSKINVFTCNLNDYYYPINTIHAAGKGESISDLDSLKNAGWGAKASGGGGGMDPNTGGGGGGNGNIGGKGGYGYGDCAGYNTNGGWGLGGNSLTYNNTTNKVFLGGAGGAGHCNNGFVDPSVNTDFDGGNGGGIIMISTNNITANNNSIISNGDKAYELTGPGYLAHDGMGGGGAGGTVLIKSNTYTTNLNIKAIGGKGGDMSSSTSGGRVGPGGGGSGGVVWLSQNTVPSNISVLKNGGLNGVILQDSNNPYGATAGLDGLTTLNLALVIDTSNVNNKIDSVRFNNTALTCNSYNFNGFAYPITTNLNTWAWSFGDGNTANTQNTSHTYSAIGLNTVKLVVTNGLGCSDSISAIVQPSFATADAGNDTSICRNSTNMVLQGKTVGGVVFAWQPAKFLNDSTLLQPTAKITTDTKFYLSVKNALGCTSTDSVILSVMPLPTFTISPNTSICNSGTTKLLATGGYNYQWSPVTGLSNATVANPVASPLQSTNYSVFITETKCNDTATLNTLISVLPNPTISAASANDVDCTSGQSQLTASGASQYIWTPATGLNNATVYNPIAAPAITTTYTVVGKDANGCSDSSKVIVNVSQNGKSGYYMPNAFTPNGDGKNDCFGIRYWGQITTLQFSIYDRFGKKVFYTENAGDCWDGTFNGEQQKADNYVYYIKANTVCGSVNKSGSVILIR